MRRKRVELEQAVITAAREWRNSAGSTVTAQVVSLIAAVDALYAYEVAELTGAGARWVEGSPETSRGAAGLAVPVQGSARHRIVAALTQVPRLALPGYTDAQLEHVLGGSHQTISSARNWLCEAGWLIDSGVRRLTPSKRPAVVWKLSEAAWDRLREGP
jgi:hypothetical protein